MKALQENKFARKSYDNSDRLTRKMKRANRRKMKQKLKEKLYEKWEDYD